MLYVLASFKKEIGYLLDIIEVIQRKRIEKKVYYRCRLNDYEFYIVKTGMGKKSISEDVVGFKDCDYLISTGFCGALVNDVKTGDVIVSEGIAAVRDKNIYSSLIRGKEVEKKNLRFESINFNQETINRFINELESENLNVRVSKSFTSPKIVRNKAQKSILNKITGAEVVDMEDIFRFDFAKMIGADFLSIRVVLDEISDDVPGFADGFKMGQKLTGIISKMDRAAQSIAVAIERYIGLLNE